MPAAARHWAGWAAHLANQPRAAEERLRQAEQETSPSPDALPECAKQPSEFAKQQEASASREEAILPPTDTTEAGERQSQLRALASGLLYWKDGLKVLRQAQLPTWRGCFQWQIETQIEAVQAAYARLR